MGTWFFLIDRLDIAIVAFSLAGSLIAFLKYNVTPAQIFMGDTGSLLLGLVCSILAILFIDIHKDLGDHQYAFKSAPTVAIAVMILPLFDTLRVFIIRILNGKSPFYPDRTHIHHLMIDCGLSHMNATYILLVVNTIFIFIAVGLQNVGNLYLLLILIIIAIVLTTILKNIAGSKKTSST